MDKNKVVYADIEALNKTIKKLNSDKIKAEAQKEMHLKRLKELLANYNKQYGIDLNGKTMSLTKKSLERELESVTTEVSEEYELATKVITLINSGDIAGAKHLLGTNDVEEDLECEVEEVLEEEEVEEEVECEVEEILEEVVEEDLEEEVLEEEVEEESEEDLEEEVFIKPRKAVIPKKTTTTTKKPVILLPDDDDEPIIMKEKKLAKESINKGGMNDIDFNLDDDDDDLLGFATMLKGTKFGK